MKSGVWISAAIIVALTASGYAIDQRIKRQRSQVAEQKAAAALQAELSARDRRDGEHRRRLSMLLKLYDTYSSTERYRQYGLVTDSMRLFYEKRNEFTPIEQVTEKTVCPKPVKRAPNGFTFYGARNLVLSRRDQFPLFYSTSYQGSNASIRGGDSFDSLLDLGDLKGGSTVHLSENDAANLMQKAPLPLHRNGSFYTPFSFNTADLNGDGTDDFVFGGRLFLSSGGTFKPIADTKLDGREVIFVGNDLVSPNGDTIETWRYDGQRLTLVQATKLEEPAATDHPFTVLPLGGALTTLADVIIVTATSYDFYALGENHVERILSLPSSTPHNLIIGARGDFDGDGVADLWLAESRFRNKDGQIIGRTLLLSSRKFSKLAKTIEDLAAFTLSGSRAYTDYDGIGTSLSSIAGDFDADGIPDLSVPGHIHMNEAGAMYILRGKDIVGKTGMDITDPAIIRIVGRAVSNLAPPYVHYDMPSPSGRSRIVVAADNDLCPGAAGGAILILDPSRAMSGVAGAVPSTRPPG